MRCDNKLVMRWRNVSRSSDLVRDQHLHFCPGRKGSAVSGRMRRPQLASPTAPGQLLRSIDNLPSVLCTLYSALYTLYSVPLSRGLVLVMVSDVGVVVMAQAGCRLVPPSWPLQTRYKIGFPAHWRPVQCQWLASPAGRSRPPSCPHAGDCHLAACTVNVDEVVNLPIQSSKLTWLETKKKSRGQ